MELVSNINNYIQDCKWKLCFDALLLTSPFPTPYKLEEKFYEWLNIVVETFSDVENLNDDIVNVLDVLLAICINDLKKPPPKIHISKLYQYLSKHHEDIIERKILDKVGVILKTYTICMERGVGYEPQIIKQYGAGLERTILACVDMKNERLLQQAARCLTALNSSLANSCSSNVGKGDDAPPPSCIDRVLEEMNETLQLLKSVYDEGGVPNVKTKLNPLRFNVQRSSFQNFAFFQTRLHNLVFLLTNLLRGSNGWLLVPLASLFDTLTTTISSMEGMLYGSCDKSKLELVLEKDSAAADIIAPCIFENVLAILDAIILCCGQSILPFLNYIITYMYNPIITFIATSRPGPQRKLENLDKDSSYYGLATQLQDSLKISVLTSLNVMFRKMGAHVDLDKKLGNSIAKFIKSQMMAPSNRINLKLTEEDSGIASRFQQSLSLVKSIFLCLNSAYQYNKTLLQDVLAYLLSSRKTLNRSCNARIYLECLFAYTITFPHESQELLCQILDCFKIHSSSPAINVSAYAQESLATLEAIIHPRFTVTPHLDLASQGFLLRLDSEHSDSDGEEPDHHISQPELELKSEVKVQEDTDSSYIYVEQKTVTEIEIDDSEDTKSSLNHEEDQPAQNEASKRPIPPLSNTPFKKQRFEQDKLTSPHPPISEDLRKILDSFHPQSSSSDSE